MKHQIVLLCLIVAAIGAKAAPQHLSVDTFIVNGTISTGSPSFALVTYTNAQFLGFFGGGSLISVTHVVTVAHSIVGFVSWNVGYGTNQVNTLIRQISTNALSHPNFVEATRLNDIGIITLPAPVTLTPNVQPIALPQIDQNLPFDYEQGRIHGFGFVSEPGAQSPTLQVTYQRVTNHTQCLATLGTVQVAQQFCAQDLSRNSNVCVGDLGGGFIVPYRGVDLLVGISSATMQSCNTLSPAIYIRVSNYRTWIRQNTGV